MKAALSINTRKAIEREVAKELERQRAVVYRQAAEDLMPQALAFFLWTMQLNYGWGRVLDYIGVGWRDEVFDMENAQLSFEDIDNEEEN